MTASEYIVISNRADTPFPVTRNLSEEPQPEAPPAEQAPRRALGFPEQGSKGSGYLSAGGGGGDQSEVQCQAGCRSIRPREPSCARCWRFSPKAGIIETSAPSLDHATLKPPGLGWMLEREADETTRGGILADAPRTHL